MISDQLKQKERNVKAQMCGFLFSVQSECLTWCVGRSGSQSAVAVHQGASPWPWKRDRDSQDALLFHLDEGWSGPQAWEQSG